MKQKHEKEGSNLLLRRAVAYLIDLLILGSCLFIYRMSAGVFYQSANTYQNGHFMGISALLMIFFLCAYIPVKTQGQTVGKMLLKLQVHGVEGHSFGLWKSFLREFCIKVSFITFFIPLTCIYQIVMFIKTRKLTFYGVHDVLLKTQVISKN